MAVRDGSGETFLHPGEYESTPDGERREDESSLRPQRTGNRASVLSETGRRSRVQVESFSEECGNAEPRRDRNGGLHRYLDQGSASDSVRNTQSDSDTWRLRKRFRFRRRLRFRQRILLVRHQQLFRRQYGSHWRQHDQQWQRYHRRRNNYFRRRSHHILQHVACQKHSIGRFQDQQCQDRRRIESDDVYDAYAYGSRHVRSPSLCQKTQRKTAVNSTLKSFLIRAGHSRIRKTFIPRSMKRA